MWLLPAMTPPKFLRTEDAVRLPDFLGNSSSHPQTSFPRRCFCGLRPILFPDAQSNSNETRKVNVTRMFTVERYSHDSYDNDGGDSDYDVDDNGYGEVNDDDHGTTTMVVVVIIAVVMIMMVVVVVMVMMVMIIMVMTMAMTMMMVVVVMLMTIMTTTTMMITTMTMATTMMVVTVTYLPAASKLASCLHHYFWCRQSSHSCQQVDPQDSLSANSSIWKCRQWSYVQN